MTYRVSRAVKPLIEVECAVTHPARSRTEFLVKARANFKDRSTATGVEIALPLPEDAVAPSARTSSGIEARVCRPSRRAARPRLRDPGSG